MKKLLTIALVAFGVNAFAQSASIKWQKTFGGSADETSKNLIATKDGGFIMIGAMSSGNGDVSGNHGGSDAWVVKLDAGMNIEWQKPFGGSGDDEGSSIIQTKDGGYVFVTSGAYVMKTDSVGTLLWSKQYGYSLSSIEQTADGGFITSGSVTSASQGVTPVMMKLDDTGTLQWQSTIHVSSSIEWITSVHQTTDGGI